VERGETLVEAARRELREETGLEAEVGRLTLVCEAIEPGGRHLVNLVFAARATSPEPGPAPPADPGLRDPAIEEVRWVTREELLALEMHPPIAAAVAAAWDAGFAGEVQVLGNVWVPDPGGREGPEQTAVR
jgi:ADP-ribose pyrophosphatase YjhB (NUDIX family)